jgi:hypothetical protein
LPAFPLFLPTFGINTQLLPSYPFLLPLGFNTSLFAYGQTGSGKSYSMLGYGEDKGIIPRVCEELFVKIKKIDDPNIFFKVEVSFMEIYNEAVKDLLDPKKNAVCICLRFLLCFWQL